MHEEGLSLKKLGEEAVRLREARGLSQKDVAETLHIRERFVDAIEKGDEGCFPAPIYARGFIRNYLEFLGAGQLWKAFAEEVPLEQPDDIDTDSVVACSPLSAGFRRISRRWIYLMVVGLAILTAGVVWKEWDILRAQIGQGGRPDAASVDRALTPLPLLSPTAIPTPAQRGALSGGSSDVGTPGASKDASVGGKVLSPETLSPEPHRSADAASEDYPWLKEMNQIAKSQDAEGKNLILLASSSCWVRAVQGGKTIFESTMKEGEERRIPLTSPVRVRMGRSSAITATWGGQTRNVGKSTGGGSVTVEFFPDGTMEVK